MMQIAVAGLRTKSDQIRALLKIGATRSQIAKFLGILYQHVRNVEMQPLPKVLSAGAGDANRPQAERNVLRSAVRLIVRPDGAVLVPPDLLKGLGVGPSKEIVAICESGELRLVGREQAVAKAREAVRRYVPDGVSLADELIAEREAEAHGAGTGR
jgi:hypothetical protein